MKTYIVTNTQKTKGILVKAQDCDQARRKAKNYYSPFPTNDLNTLQVYEKGKHLFVSTNGNKKFAFLQFYSLGGVTTTYNADIDTEPTERQLNFLGKPIEYIKFFSEEKER